MSITYREPAKVVMDILLGMPAIGPLTQALLPSQVIMSYQKYDIPAAGLFFALSYISGKAIGSVNEVQSVSGVLTEFQSVAMHDVIQVDMMAFEDKNGISLARLMRGPVIMALKSSYAQQLQEKYNCRISTIPTQWNDVSGLETTQFLTRYTMDVSVMSVQSQTVTPDYYGTFPVSPALVNA